MKRAGGIKWWRFELSLDSYIKGPSDTWKEAHKVATRTLYGRKRDILVDGIYKRITTNFKTYVDINNRELRQRVKAMLGDPTCPFRKKLEEIRAKTPDLKANIGKPVTYLDFLYFYLDQQGDKKYQSGQHCLTIIAKTLHPETLTTSKPVVVTSSAPVAPSPVAEVEMKQEVASVIKEHSHSKGTIEVKDGVLIIS